jgi:hypothetical protein
VGAPAASQSTLAPGAGHGGEGDASLQGPAQEQIDTLPEQPKPTYQAEPANTDAPSAIIALRPAKSDAGDTTAAMHETSGLVMTRPKPEKRKNAKERAEERAKKRNGKAETVDETAGAPAVAGPEASGLATAHPKPAKRLNAKERAKAKLKVKPAEDGTTPVMTAKAKSKADLKTDTKSETKTKRRKPSKVA